MPGDLHNHTTYSDGSVPVARLPLMAARVGLDAMAISDHDTLRSVQYAYDHPVQDGVKLIPATELTGYDYERQHRVHLLAYWPDPESEALRRHCDIMRQRRNECCLQSARELEAIFPQFRTEQALEYARDSGVLYKSGIMQALRELGLADSIYGVIFQYGQFDVARTGAIHLTPNELSVVAAKLCLEGYNTVGDSKWFLNPKIGSAAWFNTYKTLTYSIADHDFYA